MYINNIPGTLSTYSIVLCKLVKSFVSAIDSSPKHKSQIFYINVDLYSSLFPGYFNIWRELGWNLN